MDQSQCRIIGGERDHLFAGSDGAGEVMAGEPELRELTPERWAAGKSAGLGHGGIRLAHELGGQTGVGVRDPAGGVADIITHQPKVLGAQLFDW
ncbi:MAG: hypothetical protein D6757_03460 [Alphaproteobacteria bacterium]|nr:MAG: hypothetical protein D6757_03460 [Alphaproteobacteria bacterium]